MTVKIKDIRNYVLSAGLKLELELHGVTGGGKVKEVLKVAVDDVVVDKVGEIIFRGGFLSGPKLITFQSEEPELEEEEEEEDVSKK